MRAPQTILIALALVGGVMGTSPASPFATQVIRAQGPFGASVYGDTNAVLGAPATRFYDPFGAFSGGSTNRRVKLVEPAYNIAPDTNGLLTPNLLLTLNGGSAIIARFDQPVYDNPANPYGIDLLVFGNTFYMSDSSVNDSTDMSACKLTGNSNDEPLKVSVSPGYTGQPGENAGDPDTWPWYRYDAGPYGDSVFPTQAFQWNRQTASWSDTLMDFTKPVNPAMKTLLEAGGVSAADAIDLYVGSGGGTGFDLGASGFAWIQYVKVEGIDPDCSGGEIDAFAIVRPMSVGDTLSVTPENLLSNTATLFFQQPGAPDENEITLAFTALDAVAQVSTAGLTNLAAFAALPGTPSTAVQMNLSPILGTAAVNFSANLALSAGANYSGNGGDLLVLQSSGTNWTLLPFTFQAANRQARVTGITNLSAFVVAQFAAPALRLNVADGNCNLSFAPVAGLAHTLERSTNLINWTTLNSFTASNALVVTITNRTSAGAEAFYRVRLDQP